MTGRKSLYDELLFININCHFNSYILSIVNGIKYIHKINSSMYNIFNEKQKCKLYPNKKSFTTVCV